MSSRFASVARTCLPVAGLLLPATSALAHSGHGAPEVHAHAGSPPLLAALAIVALGVAALLPLARFIQRRRRLRRQG